MAALFEKNAKKNANAATLAKNLQRMDKPAKWKLTDKEGVPRQSYSLMGFTGSGPLTSAVSAFSSLREASSRHLATSGA